MTTDTKADYPVQPPFERITMLPILRVGKVITKYRGVPDVAVLTEELLMTNHVNPVPLKEPS